MITPLVTLTVLDNQAQDSHKIVMKSQVHHRGNHPLMAQNIISPSNRCIVKFSVIAKLLTLNHTNLGFFNRNIEYYKIISGATVVYKGDMRKTTYFHTADKTFQKSNDTSPVAPNTIADRSHKIKGRHKSLLTVNSTLKKHISHQQFSIRM